MTQPEANLLTSTTSDHELDSYLVDALETLRDPALVLDEDSDLDYLVWNPFST